MIYSNFQREERKTTGTHFLGGVTDHRPIAGATPVGKAPAVGLELVFLLGGGFVASLTEALPEQAEFPVHSYLGVEVPFDTTNLLHSLGHRFRESGRQGSRKDKSAVRGDDRSAASFGRARVTADSVRRSRPKRVAPIRSQSQLP